MKFRKKVIKSENLQRNHCSVFVCIVTVDYCLTIVLFRYLSNNGDLFVHVLLFICAHRSKFMVYKNTQCFDNRKRHKISESENIESDLDLEGKPFSSKTELKAFQVGILSKKLQISKRFLGILCKNGRTGSAFR